MTNRQLAAARRVMNAYPAFRVEKNGAVLTPYKGRTAGASVTITDWMSESDVVRELAESCAALDG